VGALAYLDFAHARNQAAAVLRSPARLALWTPYLLMLMFLSVRRAFSAHHPGSDASLVLAPPVATLLAGGFICALGVMAGLAAGGRATAFRSRSEAIIFVNAGVPSLAIALCLQVRKFLSAWPRWLVTVLYLFVFLATRAAGNKLGLSLALGSFAVFASLSTVELPVYLLSRRRFGAIAGYLGWTAAVAGGTYAAIGLAGNGVWTRAIALLGYDPGAWLRAIVAGDARALAVLCAIPIMLVLAIAAFGRDAIPELYAVSMQMFALNERRRSRTQLFDAHVSSERARARVPSGALAIVWQDWVGVRRRRGGPWLWIAAAAFWSAMGAGITYALMTSDSMLATSLVTTSLGLALGVPLMATISIAEDLAKPIWWLAADPLLSRLTAWTFSRSWRGGTSVALLPIVMGVSSGRPAFAVVGALGAIGVWWTLYALGLALYAAFPSRTDERGPIMFLRFVLSGALLVPAFVAGLFGYDATQNGVLAFAFAIGVLLVEGLAALAFATYRFSEQGASIAMLERAG
jgi:hypothetical protein